MNNSTGQRAFTARGFAFFGLEDRHTRVQLIIRPDLWKAHRQLLWDTTALIAFGTGPSLDRP